MSDKEIDKELNEQELKRVSNALDALQQHKQTPTKQGWEAIMEESKTRSIKVTKRTKILSVAATAAIVLAVAGAVLIATQNNETAKTVDQEKKETVSTSTTKPLTPEERLLANSYLLKGNDNSDLGGLQTISSALYDPKDQKLIKEFNFKNIGLNNTSVSGQHVTFTDVFECEGLDGPITHYEIDTFSKEMIKLDSSIRSWSPSGDKYAETETNCAGTFPTKFIDLKTGKSKTFSVESGPIRDRTIDGRNFRVRTDTTMDSVTWIDESRFVFSRVTREVYAETETFSTPYGESKVFEGQPTPVDSSLIRTMHIGDLNKSFDLTNAESILGTLNIPEFNEYSLILDAQSFKGKDYALIQSEFYDTEVKVVNLNTGAIAWRKVIPGADLVEGISFGTSINDIYGSFASSKDVFGPNGSGVAERKAFGYSQDSGTFITPNGAILIPKK